MLKRAALIAGKDCRLILFRGGAFAQALLLGLLLVFVFSLSLPPGETAAPQAAAAIFWLSSTFCVVLTFNMLYSLEEITQARAGLLLMPAPVQAVWLGKAVAGLLVLLAAQAVFFPAIVVFLAQNAGGNALHFVLMLMLVDVGLAGLGSLLGALAPGPASGGARESLLSVIVFPLLIPLLLAGIAAGASVFSPEPTDFSRWIGLAAAWDAVFLGAALLLFPFVFGDDA